MSMREHKGNSLLDCLDDYVAIDVETTGYDPNFCEIIEIGAVKISDGREIGRFQSLVKPESPVSAFITNLTGISNEMLEPAPPLYSILPEFLNFIDGQVLVGHNVSFDINFLYDGAMIYCDKYVTNDCVDTLRLSRLLFPHFENHKLQTLVRNFQIANNTEHRALSDSIMAYRCYEYIKQYIAEKQIQFTNRRSHRRTPGSHRRTPPANPLFHIPDAPAVQDADNPLLGKVCVFTGTLEKLKRADAMQLVTNCGGVCGDAITAKTNYLILGNNDFCKSIKDGKSNKQKKAEAYMLKGHDIMIISENAFYDMLYEAFGDALSGA